MEAKIIVITGGPRTGKSTLVKLLADKLGAVPLLEGEEKDFPERIWNDIKTGENILELLLWFRNKAVSDYQKSLDLKKQGKSSVMDTFWMTNDVYVEEWVKDPFVADLMKNVGKLDYEILPWPDTVISLFSDKEKIREFAEAGERDFEQAEDYLIKQVALNETHEKYFRSLDEEIVFIDRSDIDFTKEEDLQNLIAKI